MTDRNYKDYSKEKLDGSNEISNFLNQIKIGVSNLKDQLGNEEKNTDDYRNSLQEIQEQILSSNIDTQNKKEILARLAKLDNNVEKGEINVELNGVIDLLNGLTQSELSQLQHDIIKSNGNPYGFSTEQFAYRQEASDNLNELPNNDSNPIANRAIKHIKSLLS